MKRSFLLILAATILFATAFTLLLAAPSPVSAGGMVANQGFEDPLGAEWATVGLAGRVGPPVHSGSCAAQITGSGGILTQWVTDIVPLGRYECWGWIYATANVTAVIELEFWGNTTQLSPTTTLSATNTGGSYQQKTAIVRAPVEATRLRIRLVATGTWGSGEDVRFDDIGVNPPAAGCFIATAAYGTETAGELDVLRAFRDQVLLQSPMGSQLVAWYYQVSPPVADFISQSSLLRSAVRELLIDPLVSLAKLTQGIWGD